MVSSNHHKRGGGGYLGLCPNKEPPGEKFAQELEEQKEKTRPVLASEGGGP